MQEMNGLDWQTVNEDDWDEGTMVVGGIAVMKIITPAGKVGFQILTVASDTLNIMEKVGMAHAVDSYYSMEMDDHITGDD